MYTLIGRRFVDLKAFRHSQCLQFRHQKSFSCCCPRRIPEAEIAVDTVDLCLSPDLYIIIIIQARMDPEIEHLEKAERVREPPELRHEARR